MSDQQGQAAPEAPQPYIGNDGRRKATFEESFRLDRATLEKMPWQFSWQRNERTLKFTDETRAHLVKASNFVAATMAT